MKQQIRRQLLSLAIGEFVAILFFAFALWRVRESSGPPAISLWALLGYATVRHETHVSNPASGMNLPGKSGTATQQIGGVR